MKRTLRAALFLTVAAVGAACAAGPRGGASEATHEKSAPNSAEWVAAADPCWCGAAVGGLASGCTTQAEPGSCAARAGCTWICE